MTTRTAPNATPAGTSLPATTNCQFILQPLQTVALTPKAGPITKRLLLAWLYCLKEIQKLPPAESYRMKMAGLMRYLDTRDYKEIKDEFRRMNVTQVEWNDCGPESERWGVGSLVAQAEIIREKHGNFIEVSLPPKLNAGIRAQRQFSELSLLMVRQIRSTSGLNLYRIATAYQTNPSGLTFRAPPEIWAPKLTGNPNRADELASSRRRRQTAKLIAPPKFEYKYFKRDVLLPAIHEINALTDVRVELVEHHEGKRVTEIQFRVMPKEAQPFVLDAAHDELEAVAVEAAALGIARQVIRKFARKFGVEQVRRNLKYTIARKNNGAEIRDVRRYLTAAVANDYAAGLDVAAAATNAKARQDIASWAKKPADDELAAPLEALRAQRRREAERVHREMREEDQKAKWETYLGHLESTGHTFLLKSAKTKGLMTELARQGFFNWVAEETWGPITDRELLAFVVKSRRAA